MTDVYDRESANRSPSKRWTTTAGSAMDEVSKAMFKNPATKEGRMHELNNRKLANTTTSIRFGNDAVSVI
jgi:hypothetical protein